MTTLTVWKFGSPTAAAEAMAKLAEGQQRNRTMECRRETVTNLNPVRQRTHLLRSARFRMLVDNE